MIHILYTLPYIQVTLQPTRNKSSLDKKRDLIDRVYGYSIKIKISGRDAI